MHLDEHVNNSSGGRTSTKLSRHLDNYSQNFGGLPEGINRYHLIRLVKRVGRKLGFTGVLISHLEYLINHTRDCDWGDGGRPIVYKTVQKTALELGLTERQINNREHSLHELKVLSWTELGNHRRTGKRNQRGNIVFAYGVNLAPLAALYDELLQLEKEQIAYEEDWMAERRRHSNLKRYVLAKIEEAIELGAHPIDLEPLQSRLNQIGRIRASVSLEKLSQLTLQLEGINNDLDSLILDLVETTNNVTDQNKTSAKAEENFRPKYYTSDYISLKKESSNQQKVKQTDAGASDFEEDANFADAQRRGSSGEPVRRSAQVQSLNDIITSKNRGYVPPDAGIKHISLGNALAAASDGFKFYIPDIENAGWAELVEAAAWLCHDLGINRHAWVDACAVMGRNAAAMAVLVVDRNLHHPDYPVKSPGGALCGMTKKAENNELHLHRSLFGILQRDGLGG